MASLKQGGGDAAFGEDGRSDGAVWWARAEEAAAKRRADAPDQAYVPDQAWRAALAAAEERAIAALPRVSRAKILTMIESEVIPRLLLAHRADDQPAAPATRRDVRQDDCTALAERALSSDLEALGGCLAALAQDGLADERAQIALFTGAARRLGEWWEEDRADFTAVTVAMGLFRRWVLERGLSDIAARSAGELGGVDQLLADPGPAQRARTVMAASFPGDQHDFGALMLAEVFRRRGWFVVDLRPDSSAALEQGLTSAAIDVLCLSITGAHKATAIEQVIGRAKAAAKAELRVVIGGRAIDATADFAASVGADAALADPIAAAHLVERWFAAASAHR